MLVVTTGHLDHGKTSLICALTGTPAGPLAGTMPPGATVDLGFTYWRPDAGEIIGFIDVPGHERFARNMLAGVTGADLALLVVAADEGVMPQTVEHVEMLDLLRIERGVVAITKCDCAGPGQIAAARAQATALLARTGLAKSLVFEVSATTGKGMDLLAAALRDARAAIAARPTAERNFRMAIDRAFTVTGAGTVATGTVLTGAIEPGARLVIAPGGRDVRVRSLQRAGERSTRVEAGGRCAVNLAGIGVADLHRGDWLITPEMYAPTARIAALVRLAHGRAKPLEHYMPVHLHIGAADIPARLLIPNGGSIAPGSTAQLQLALERRTSAVVGQRFVLRDQSGRELLGGGQVIDPFAAAERRRPAESARVLAAMALAAPADTLAALLAIPGHETDTRRFEQAFNLTAAAARALYAAHDVTLLGRSRTVALPASRVASIGAQVLHMLADHHRMRADANGMPMRELKAALDVPVSAETFHALLRDLCERQLVVLDGLDARLPGRGAASSTPEIAQWNQLLPWLESRGQTAFAVADVTGRLQITAAAATALLDHGRRSGDLWRITETRFMLRGHLMALAENAAALDRQHAGEGFTAAQFRDATGLGRNLVIQILELFDAIGVTARRGDRRLIERDHRRAFDTTGDDRANRDAG